MNDVALSLGSMSMQVVDAVTRFEGIQAKLPQVDIQTGHVFHAGMYARTIMIPAGVVLTGALIKIPTLLIIDGDAEVYTDDGPVHISGYAVMQGSAGRKQVFVAKQDTYLTMVFPTNAKTVEEAEVEFTDEFDKLLSRNDGADNHVTGA